MTTKRNNTELSDESDEDKELKEELQTLVERLEDKNELLYLPSLEMLRYLIRTATTSMTAVPKPLKYLSPYYERLKLCHHRIRDARTRRICSDIISVLAINSETGRNERDCLQYCLIGNMSNVGDWGHEYVRRLETEIVEEWCSRTDDCVDLLPLVCNVVKFDGEHHAEIEACDLLMEIDRLDLLSDHIVSDTYQRICLYLASCANYVDEIESEKILKYVVKQYTRFKEYIKALIIAMQMRDEQLIDKLFKLCKDPLVLKQMCYLAGKHQIHAQLQDNLPDKEELDNIMYNTNLNFNFQSLARQLDIMEPKTTEEVFKVWLEPTPLRRSLIPSAVDSARQNLATTFANAFINAGFSRDKLMTTEEGSRWIYRNKDHGMLSATASLGLIHLWDVDGGLTPIDKYLYSNDVNIKAGALLALGIVNVRVRNECDPALALLSDYIQHKSSALQVGSIFGLGLAYAGTNRTDVLDLLLPIILTPKVAVDVLAIASVSCGLIAVSSCNDNVTSTIIQKLIDSKGTNMLNNIYTKFIVLGLGLCFIGKRDAIEVPSVMLEVLNEPFRSFSQNVLKMCAYAGTGDVLIVQEFLHTISVRFEALKRAESDPKKTKPKAKRNDTCEIQAICALGVGVVSMGEDIGKDMSARIFGHMAQYGDVCMRKTVPLAIALCSLSDPQIATINILNKYSHDPDDMVSCNAIFAMGLVGAGTNNTRLAIMLRQLAGFHNRNPNQLFMVRLAQGLVYLGKGTITLNPLHMDKQLFCTTALAGLLITIIALIDNVNIIFGKAHYLLYSLSTAMQPRWLITLNENMEEISVPVRVGQAVDVVAKAGTPKTISGIHTHSTPVLLAVGERAELATDHYDQLTPIMEGIVILRKKD